MSSATEETPVMQLFVKSLDGETFSVEVAGSQQTVDNIMQRIEDIEGVPVPLQILTFEGKELELGRTLEYYKLQNKCTLHLSLELNGGASGRGGESMQIFVKGLDGDTFTVETSQQTVDEVMQHVEEIEGVPVPMQRLVFEGKELEAGRTLDYYKIQHESTLHLTMDLNGGYYYGPSNLRVLAMYHLINKQICRKCYGRLSPDAKRCNKAKCGRTTDIRPKKGFHRTEKHVFSKKMTINHVTAKYPWFWSTW